MKSRKIWVDVTSYSLIFIVIIAALYFKNKYESEIEEIRSKNEVAFSITKSLEIEQSFNDYQLPDFPLTTEKGETASLYQLLSPDKVNLLILVALTGCDSCRDQELRRWGLFSQDREKVRAFVIVVDENIESADKSHQLASMGKALSGLPIYFDVEERIEELLGISNSDTPLMFFVGSSGEVLFNYKGTYLAQDRSESFLELMEYVLENLCREE
jgi:hypothetical protein